MSEVYHSFFTKTSLRAYLSRKISFFAQSLTIKYYNIIFFYIRTFNTKNLIVTFSESVLITLTTNIINVTKIIFHKRGQIIASLDKEKQVVYSYTNNNDFHIHF